MDWAYLTLRHDGRLIDEDGALCIAGNPRFDSIVDAEAYLEANDIRASVQSR